MELLLLHLVGVIRLAFEFLQLLSKLQLLLRFLQTHDRKVQLVDVVAHVGLDQGLLLDLPRQFFVGCFDFLPLLQLLLQFLVHSLPLVLFGHLLLSISLDPPLELLNPHDKFPALPLELQKSLRLLLFECLQLPGDDFGLHLDSFDFLVLDFYLRTQEQDLIALGNDLGQLF